MDNIKGITNCSQCGRGCHVSALMCGRGIRFFEILKSSDTEEKEEKKGCCGSGEGVLFYTSRLIYSQASAQKISSSPNRAKPLLC